MHVSSLFEGYIDDAVTSIGVFDNGTPTFVTLYDLIPLLQPDQYLKHNPGYNGFYMQKIEYLKHASGFLSISEFAASEAIKTLHLSDEFVTNISAACDPIFKVKKISSDDETELRKRFGLYKPYLMYTGGSDERKNLHRLIRAYAKLHKQFRKALQLALVGKMPQGNVRALRKTARSAGLKRDEVVLTGYVSDDDLVNLYNLCKLFIFPSWYEGFGLPVLEAMSCGAPVIAGHSSSLPEVIGLEDALFDPFDESSIKQKLYKGLTDDSFRDKLICHNNKQLKTFSWDESAKRGLAAFEKLHAGKIKNRTPIQDISRDVISAIARIDNIQMDEEDLITTAWSIAGNMPVTTTKQLLVDVSEISLGDAKTGVQRVTRNILRELLKSPLDGYRVEPVYGTQDRCGYRYARQFTMRLQGSSTDISEDDPIEVRQGDIFLGLDLQHHVVMAQKQYLEQVRQRGVFVAFVLYDMLPIVLPHCFPYGAREGHSKWLKTISEFDAAICISRSVTREFIDWLEVHGPKRLRPFLVSWFHLGADFDRTETAEALPKDAGLVIGALTTRPSFLMVGTLEPRKGHRQTVAAFEHLWSYDIDVNLVMVGKRGWMVDELIEHIRRHPEINKRLFWLEQVDDEYLEKIYEASTCLIAASEGEGFGLPLIEAAKHGVHIIARDLPVFYEVAGDHAYYFTGGDPYRLALSIHEWLKLYKRGDAPKSADLHYLTWEESSKNLMKAIRGLLEKDQCLINNKNIMYKK